MPVSLSLSPKLTSFWVEFHAATFLAVAPWRKEWRRFKGITDICYCHDVDDGLVTKIVSYTEWPFPTSCIKEHLKHSKSEPEALHLASKEVDLQSSLFQKFYNSRTKQTLHIKLWHLFLVYNHGLLVFWSESSHNCIRTLRWIWAL